METAIFAGFKGHTSVACRLLSDLDVTPPAEGVSVGTRSDIMEATARVYDFTTLLPPARDEAVIATAVVPDATMLAAHMHLVHRIVARFVRRLPRSVQREDLVSAGTIGLFHALRTNTRTDSAEMFAAYACIRIRGSIVDELRRHDWSPRRRRTPAASSAAPASNVVPFRPRNADSLPPPPEPSAATPVAVVGFDDLPPHQSEMASEGVSALDQLAEQSELAALRRAVDLLEGREREIVKLRYFEGMPSKAIASTLGLSEARISQLHARATARLREILAGADELELAA
jgi:RNA polymerase sigma factor FliA